MLFLVTSFQFKFHKNKKILNVCYCAKFFLSTKVCRCQGLIYRVLVLKLLCSRYIVLHVWLTCQGVHKYIDHNPDKIVWNTFWRSISFSECSKKRGHDIFCKQVKWLISDTKFTCATEQFLNRELLLCTQTYLLMTIYNGY